MSWTSRMARQGTDSLSLHSLTMNSTGNSVLTPTSSSSLTMNSTTKKLTSENEMETEKNCSAISPSMESRIPRPSPTALRRSASLRLRGERGSHLRSPIVSSTIHNNYQIRNNSNHNYLQSQLNAHEFFPIINENGSDTPRNRSSSLSLTPARPRPIHTTSGCIVGFDDSDVESVKSYGSACSTASACDHASFALNGTTWSGRSRKYVVHCSNHSGDTEQYLTPTQRAARQIRRFQILLKEAKKEIEEKNQEIVRLTKEVVELRLHKASLNSPEEKTDSSDAPTIRENDPFSPQSPTRDLPDEGRFENVTSPEKQISSEVPSSLADSGHFEDSSIHSKEAVFLPEANITSTTINNNNNNNNNLVAQQHENSPNSTFNSIVEIPDWDEERRKLVNHYEGRIEELHRRHVDELQELKEKHNDKVESLLNQLAEVNTRYCEIRPSVDTAEIRVRELETELDAVKSELTEQKALLSDQEERNKQMYLKMFAKGQEAARIEQTDQILEHAHETPPKVTVAELLQQLTVTQAELENIKAMYRRIVESRNTQAVLDPEITLQFLKSAIYYFLTDKENHQGHLNAIESILGFNENEKSNIDKIYRSVRK
ncbi:protein quick-to-court isoform X2 [Leptopilina boulardi]|uniref:protein quick-to-court isoform X2 n=1 Tax=Leptopilina boulardi TaxID=63433 RepID=UPI0021F5E3EB|nr:protein quick-to-court isoform X2 [Leptopilina boulardi]